MQWNKQTMWRDLRLRGDIHSYLQTFYFFFTHRVLAKRRYADAQCSRIWKIEFQSKWTIPQKFTTLPLNFIWLVSYTWTLDMLMRVCCMCAENGTVFTEQWKSHSHPTHDDSLMNWISWNRYWNDVKTWNYRIFANLRHLRFLFVSFFNEIWMYWKRCSQKGRSLIWWWNCFSKNLINSTYPCIRLQSLSGLILYFYFQARRNTWEMYWLVTEVTAFVFWKIEPQIEQKTKRYRFQEN